MIFSPKFGRRLPGRSVTSLSSSVGRGLLNSTPDGKNLCLRHVELSFIDIGRTNNGFCYTTDREIVDRSVHESLLPFTSSTRLDDHSRVWYVLTTRPSVLRIPRNLLAR